MKPFLFVFLFVTSALAAQSQAPTPADGPKPDSTKLIITSGPKPFYPASVDPKVVNGEVSVKLHVNETGEVTDAEFLNGDPALKDAALETAKRWKFQPFIRNGAPIPVTTQVAIQFQEFPKRVRVSQGVMEGLILKKVPPEYPPLAQVARIQGSVVIHLLIGTNGSVNDASLISGHPMLAPAAIDAVKQWKWKTT